MERTLKSWVGPVFFVVSAAIWGIPRAPHYQEWMPYGYDLGGIALVLLYWSVGFISLGIQGLVISGMYWKSDSLQSRHVISMGAIPLGVGMGLIWCYKKLMDFTLLVPCCGG